ncbi:MAG: hypothetical protein CL607_04270 [Anaerolineaceae bacterium]|nr:hypothetical protein [Anaerolineaceae bacterium]
MSTDRGKDRSPVSIERLEAAMYGVQERTGQSSLRTLLRQPGMHSVHRIICYYGDGSAHNSIATLIHSAQQTTLDCLYEGLFEQKPLHYSVADDRYEHFCDVLHRVHFDGLYHQRDMSPHVNLLWQLERGAAQYVHSVIMTPVTPPMPYSALVNAIDAYLPEAIKRIKK